MKDNRPNILIIISDQHNSLKTGVYGHSLVQTPHMERLADRGVLFETAYTSCPICVPARMSFMTGKHVGNIGIWDNGVPLREDEVTWAHCLRKNGYSVSLSGKMHFRGHDQLHGFERQLAVDINARNQPVPPSWKEPVMEKDEPVRKMTSGPGYSQETVADELATEKAIAYIQNASHHQKPWALAVGFVAPHPPFTAPPEFYEKYRGLEVDMPEIPDGHIADLHPYYQRMRRARGFFNESLPDAVVSEVRRSYYALVSFLDHNIGLMIDTLEETGQLDNTVIIYTSDHGEMLGEHGLWYKCCFYEESARIPLLISWPGQCKGNSRVSDPVSLVDVTATILDLAGVSGDDLEVIDPDGESLLPLACNRSKRSRAVFAEYHANFSTAPTAMLRSGDFKYIYYHGEAPELYDLKADPQEFHNLAGSQEYRPIEKRLKNELLSRFSPEETEKKVLISQASRQYIEEYLFDYLEEPLPEEFKLKMRTFCNNLEC